MVVNGSVEGHPTKNLSRLKEFNIYYWWEHGQNGRKTNGRGQAELDRVSVKPRWATEVQRNSIGSASIFLEVLRALKKLLDDPGFSIQKCVPSYVT